MTANHGRALTTLRKDRIMAAEKFTRDRVLEMLNYDPTTGGFTWRQSRRGSARAGYAAGYVRQDGYVRIKLDGRQVWAHRLAWFLAVGKWPQGQIDHINGNPSDNRIANLRDVTCRVNSQNERRARRRKNGGRLLGAHWCPTWRRWKSSIGVAGSARHIGWFDTEQQAHEAYVAAKRVLHEGCTI